MLVRCWQEKLLVFVSNRPADGRTAILVPIEGDEWQVSFFLMPRPSNADHEY
jgi:hypothetical protein